MVVHCHSFGVIFKSPLEIRCQEIFMDPNCDLSFISLTHLNAFLGLAHLTTF